MLSLTLAVTAACKKENAYVPPPPPQVGVAKPLRQDVMPYLEVTGNAVAYNQVDLEARVQGYLQEINYQDGAEAKKADTLFVIEPAPYQAQLQQAQATLAATQADLVQAEAEFTRQFTLGKSDFASQSKVDEARAKRDSDKAQIQNNQAGVTIAAINLGYTQVTAPFDGRVTAHLISVGGLVGVAGPTKLATIVQLEPIYATFTVSEQQVLRVKEAMVKSGFKPGEFKGVPVEVGLMTEDGFPHVGKLDYVAPMLDPSTGTLTARGVLENQDRALLPGMFLRIRIPLALEKANALLVPDEALGADQSGSYLLVVDKDNVVQQRTVQTGQLEGKLRVIVVRRRCRRSGRDQRQPEGGARREGGAADDDDRRRGESGACRASRSGARSTPMISAFFINRPVLANVLAIVMVLIGAVAVFTLPVAQYPNVVPPTVSVTTSYPGASADTVMNTVALPIEQQVNGVQGMIYMQSTSASDGTYSLIVTFEIGTDLNFAQVLVQNRVSAAMASLPQSVQVQGVTVQQKSTSILQIVTLTSPDGRYDSLFLSNYATISLVPELSRVPGVGNVGVFGVGQYSMRIWLDPQTLQARGLAPQDVIKAIQQQSQQVTSGQVGAPPAPAGQNFQYTVNVEGRLIDPAEFANIIVKIDSANGGQITRVKDVGRVELGAQTYSQSSRLNGKPAAGIAIYQLPTANALNVATLVNARMAELAKSFPQDLTYVVPFDTTRFVTASINEVYKTLLEAAVLVLIVILVFLQDWRATLVPATTVPVTIIGAFAAMAALGFTVNLSTLFAIILAIGIVVDDAIVVVEGAAHHIERGLTPHDASIKAMDELFGPIIGITLVLMSVFIPAAFLPGLTGQMYAQFALVIAATALISAINAATLKPTQCALWLRMPVPPEKRNFFFRGFNRGYQPVENAYTRLIGAMARHSGAMVIVALIVAGIGVWGIARLPTSFIPIEDQGYVLVATQLPDGAAVGRTQQVMDQVTKIALGVPGVDQVIAISGISVLDNSATLANAGVAYVILKDWSVRKPGSGADLRSVYANLQGALDKLQDGVALVLIPPPIQGIGNASGFTMQVELRDGTFDYTKLQTITQTIVRDGNTQTGLQRLNSTFRAAVPQVRVVVDRVKAETLNVAVGDVFNVLAGYIGSSYVNQFNKFGRTFQVYVQADSKYPTSAKATSRTCMCAARTTRWCRWAPW